MRAGTFTGSTRASRRTAKSSSATTAGEIITWQTERYGGVLFASTLDPIVEHGIQQIRHLDHYVDQLVAWMCGVRPEGRFEVDPAEYGVGELELADATVF